MLFMENVEQVQQLDDSRLFWAADVGGQRKEWYARIKRQVPDPELRARLTPDYTPGCKRLLLTHAGPDLLARRADLMDELADDGLTLTL